VGKETNRGVRKISKSKRIKEEREFPEKRNEGGSLTDLET